MKKVQFAILLSILINGFFSNDSDLHAQKNFEQPAGLFLEDNFEEVNFVTDRSLYLSGETIWFSARCLLSENSKPSPFSTVLYFELFNAEKRPFKREKFKLIAGQVSGNIEIPAELPSGYYFLRAYTQFQRNFPADNYFTTCITIINPEIPLSSSGVSEVDSIRIEPNGITLVRNFPSQAGIRIPDHILKKTQALFVVDQNKKVIGKPMLYENGLAEFTFIPEDSTDYLLRIELTDGSSQLTGFPFIAEEGYSIETEKTATDLNCKISATKNKIKNQEEFKMVLFSREYDNLYETEFYVAKQKQMIQLPYHKVPEGISFLVLKNRENKVLQFKIHYRINEIIEIPVQLNKLTFLPGEMIEAEIVTPFDEFGDTAILSVTVARQGTIPLSENSLPHRFIENPQLIHSGFLFTYPPDPALIQQIEIAIILKSHFFHSSIITNTDAIQYPLVFYPEIRDVTINGFVKEKVSGIPVADVQVFMSVLFNDLQIHSARTSSDGGFIFSLNNLYGNQELYLVPEQNSENELEIYINHDFSENYPEYSGNFKPPDTTMKDLIEELMINHQVTQYFNGSTREEKESRLLPFLFGEEMVFIKPDDYVRLNTLLEVFAELIPFVKLKETNKHYHFSVFDKNSDMIYDNPLLLLDHIPVFNPDEIIKIHPAQIDEIGVITGIYVLGSNVFRSVISIRTKAGDFGGIRLPEASAFIEYQTLSPSLNKSFPDDENDISSNRYIPDFRTLLYWEPDIILSIEDRRVSFHASDYCSGYDIVVRGHKQDGTQCAGKATLKIEK